MTDNDEWKCAPVVAEAKVKLHASFVWLELYYASSSFNLTYQMVCYTEPFGMPSLVWKRTGSLKKYLASDWINHLPVTVQLTPIRSDQWTIWHNRKVLPVVPVGIQILAKGSQKKSKTFLLKKSLLCRSLLFFQWKNTLHFLYNSCYGSIDSLASFSCWLAHLNYTCSCR